MQSVSLNELAGIHLEKARGSSAGRSATTVYGDHSHELRQTLIALAGSGLTSASHTVPSFAFAATASTRGIALSPKR